jgi:hypothetical protein
MSPDLDCRYQYNVRFANIRRGLVLEFGAERGCEMLPVKPDCYEMLRRTSDFVFTPWNEVSGV